MDPGDAELLRQARDELHVVRAGIAPLRNRAKDAVAAIDRSADRMEALIDAIDARLDPHAPKEAQGHDDPTTPEDRDEVTMDEGERHWPAPRGVAEWSIP